MTAIHQSAISSHHSGSRHEGGAGHGRQATNNSTGEPSSSTVNISYQAALRLKAYQEQKEPPGNQVVNDPGAGIKNNITVPTEQLMSNSQDQMSEKATSGDLLKLSAENNPAVLQGKRNASFPQNIDTMLSEIQDNIVQFNEPGYQHLVNLLNNHGDSIADQQQLQEIMRKEQFFLNRRKPFMGSSDFHSYSQVLNQFANIVERQQYSY